MKLNMPSRNADGLNSDNLPANFSFTPKGAQSSPQVLSIDPRIALALEPRFMFDAAGLATAVAADDASTTNLNVLSETKTEAQNQSAQEAERMDALSVALATTNSIVDLQPAAVERTNEQQFKQIIEDGDELIMRTSSREVVFIDASVTDRDLFLNNIPAGAEVVTINSDSNGLTQIAEWLKHYDDISAIHIISHGDDGNVRLGNTIVNNDNLADYTEQLGSIGDALSTDGDILFYGCNLGESAEGQKFIDQLAFLTDADIAASDDATGAAKLGGDWDLEVVTGTIEANQTFSAEAMKGFTSVLAIPGPVQFDSYSGGVSDNTGNNATYTFGSYTLVLDGASFKTYSDDYGVGPGVGSTSLNETQLTISITGYTFDVTAIDVNNSELGARTLTITSDVVGDTYMYTIAGGTNQTLTLAGFNNITNLIITPNTAGAFTVDNIVTSNLGTGGGGNTPPTINLGGTTAVTVQQNVATDVDLSSLTFADADGDPLTVSLVASEGTLVSTDGNTTVGGVMITGSGSTTLVLTGSATNINTYLDTTTKINYTTPLNDTTANSIAVNAFDGTDFDASIDSITVNINTGSAAPVISNLDGDTFSFNEDSSSDQNLDVNIDSTITDADSTDFDGGNLTVSIIAGKDATEDQLGIKNSGGVTLSNGLNNGSTVSVSGVAIGTIQAVGGDQVDVGEDLVVNFNANATPANVQSLLRVLSYDNTDDDNPTAGARTIRVTVNDGDGGTSANQDVTKNVIATNDNPTVSGLVSDLSFTEETAGDLDLSASTFADVDAGSNDIVVTLTAGTGTLVASNFGGVVIGNSGTSSITLTGTVTEINTYLDTASRIQYTGATDVAGDNATTLTVTANDGGNTGTGGGTNVNLGTVNIDITNVNDVPTTSNLNGDNITYNEGDAPKLIDVGSDAIVLDGDNDFNGGNLTLTVVGGVFTEDLFGIDTSGSVALAGTTAGSNVSVGGTVIGTLGNNIASGNSLVVNFNANATQANVQTLVRALTYQNSNQDNPAAGGATLRLTINDGDGGTTANADIGLVVNAVNDAPTTSNLNGDAISYGAVNTVNVDVGSNVIVADVDSANFDGGTLTVSITSGKVAAQDFLELDTSGTVALAGTTAGSNVSVGGTVIGTLANNIAVGNDLVVNLNANATAANVQTLIQALTYRNTDFGTASLTPGARNVQVTINDGDGATSITANVNVTVTGEAPKIDSITTGILSTGFTVTLTISDADTPLSNVSFSGTSPSLTALGGATVKDTIATDGKLTFTLTRISSFSQKIQIIITDGINTTVGEITTSNSGTERDSSRKSKESYTRINSYLRLGDTTEVDTNKFISDLARKAAYAARLASNKDGRTVKVNDIASKINRQGKVQTVDLGSVSKTYIQGTKRALDTPELVVTAVVAGAAFWSRWGKRVVRYLLPEKSV